MSSADSPPWTSLTPTQLIDQILLAKANMPDFDLGRLSAEIDKRISFYEIQLREESPSSEAFTEFSLTSEAFGFEDQVSTIIKLIDPEVSASWPDILRWYVPASLSEILGWEVFASWSEMPRWEVSSFWSEIPILAAGLVMYVSVITLTLLMSTSPTNSLWVENRHVLLSTATRLVLILAMPCFILYSVPALLKIRDNVGYEKSVSHAIKNVHWTAVGLVLMDGALTFAETDESEKNCLTLLKSMNELSKLILKFQEFPRLKMEFHATLNKSIQLLVKGAILCYSWKKKILRLISRKKLNTLAGI